MGRTFGAMPGGGILSTYQFTAAEFGSIGARMLLDLLATTKLERRQAFRAVEAMLRAYKLISKNEVVQSLSLGSEATGRETLVCVTVIPHGPQKGAE